MISYQEILPDPILAEIVLSYWQFSYYPDHNNQPLTHFIPPDGCVSLFAVKSAQEAKANYLLTGPQTMVRKRIIPPKTRYWGIRFHPSSFKALFGYSPNLLKGQTILATPQWLNGLPLADFETVYQSPNFQLLNAHLNKWKPSSKLTIHPLLKAAIQQILSTNGQLKIQDIAQQNHLSMRQLQRLFKSHVGLTPKEFARIRRFRKAIIALILEKKKRQDVVFNQEYYDPSHFIREFATLANMKPSQLLDYLDEIVHKGVK